MKKIILEKRKDYTLLVRLKDNGVPLSCDPYVVAWIYNEVTDDWAQGHYFSSLRQATDFFYGRDKERENDIIADKLQSMIHTIAYNNNTFVCSCCLDTAESLISFTSYMLGADQAGIFEDEYNEIMEDNEE